MKKILLSLFAVLIYFPYTYADKKDEESIFLKKVQGQWIGPGEVVAGKYKGTRFSCTFSGIPEQKKIGMNLDGSCRVGIFSQDIKARVVKFEETYQGAFNDGAQKNGMDIISGSISGKHMVFSLVKDNINGTMTAHLTNKDTMNITLAIEVSDTMIPVIEVQLKRNQKNTIGDTAQTVLR